MLFFHVFITKKAVISRFSPYSTDGFIFLISNRFYAICDIASTANATLGCFDGSGKKILGCSPQCAAPCPAMHPQKGEKNEQTKKNHHHTHTDTHHKPVNATTDGTGQEKRVFQYSCRKNHQ